MVAFKYLEEASGELELGLAPSDVDSDGNCFFSALAVVLNDVFAADDLTELLNGEECTHASVREFLCTWAEGNAEFCVDDEGGDTIQQLAVAGMADWKKPVPERDDDGNEMSVEARFAALIERMRKDKTWADECWVRTIAPVALKIHVSIVSSAGKGYHRPSGYLPAVPPSPPSPPSTPSPPCPPSPPYQEHPPEYQEWYRVVQSPLYRPPEYQEHPPEYQGWYRVVQSPLYRPPEYQEHPPEY